LVVIETNLLNDLDQLFHDVFPALADYGGSCDVTQDVRACCLDSVQVALAVSKEQL
jgi:hypothetical protein